jgi:acetyltransferase-like isoleucine patch superfamily enzyme
MAIADLVFVGHHVVFINDRYPRATNRLGQLQTEEDWDVIATSMEKNASIGSGAVSLCAIEIGEGSMIGAGRVVTTSVKRYHVVAGNPASVPSRVSEI